MFYTRTYDVLRDIPKAPFRGSYTCNVPFEGDDNEVVLGVILKSDDDEFEVTTRKLSGSLLLLISHNIGDNLSVLIWDVPEAV